MKKLWCIIFLCLISIADISAQRKTKSIPTFNLQQADSLFAAQQWKTAIPVYEAVLKIEPNNAQGWNRLGYCYHNLLDYGKALTSYSKALSCKPTVALETIIQSRLARIYSLKNEPDMAFAALNKAVQLGFVNVGELENLTDFDNIRKDIRLNDVIKGATNNAFPCMHNTQAREFDFWIGDWDAYVTGTTQLAGQSHIEMASGGCMILEHWTSKGSVPFTG